MRSRALPWLLGRLAATAGVALVAGCGAGLGDGAGIGQEERVAFYTETGLAFTKRLAVGSHFVVTKEAVTEEDKDAVGQARLRSSSPKVMTVDADTVTIAGPGTADLIVEGEDGEIDRITLHAGIAGATTLVSGPLLSVTDTVDARLPQRFALQTDTSTTLLVSAVDKCGGDLLDLHASSLVPGGDVPVSIDSSDPASFVVTTQVPGDATLTLKTPELPDLVFDVKSVDPGAIDEVQVAPSAVNGSTVTMFGRAFVNDLELVGDLVFSWSSDPRVVLEAFQGLTVRGNISFPEEGEPPDDRPAGVTVEVFGESGTTDLITTNLVSSLGTPARQLSLEPVTPSCQGGEGCDPEAALLVILGVRGLRRLRGVRGLRRAQDLGQLRRHV